MTEIVWLKFCDWNFAIEIFLLKFCDWNFDIFCCFVEFVRLNLFVFFSLQTNLLCIMGELAGGGSLAVAVCLSDKWKVTGDRRLVTYDMWHLGGETIYLHAGSKPHWYYCHGPEGYELKDLSWLIFAMGFTRSFCLGGAAEQRLHLALWVLIVCLFSLGILMNTTPDTCNMTFFFLLFFCPILSILVSVLLSACVKRWSVSHMRDFH